MDKKFTRAAAVCQLEAYQLLGNNQFAAKHYHGGHGGAEGNTGFLRISVLSVIQLFMRTCAAKETFRTRAALTPRAAGGYYPLLRTVPQSRRFAVRQFIQVTR
jgi:hypothetical protein